MAHRWAQCLREHGATGLPDPTVQNGSVNFPSGQAKQLITQAELQACQHLAAQLPLTHRGGTISQAQLQQMVSFSRCMRAHGLPDWPDPSADGQFPLPRDIIQRGKAGMQTQLRACQHLYNGSIAISTAPGSGQ